jgi:hypothetical protein
VDVQKELNDPVIAVEVGREYYSISSQQRSTVDVENSEHTQSTMLI